MDKLSGDIANDTVNKEIGGYSCCANDGLVYNPSSCLVGRVAVHRQSHNSAQGSCIYASNPKYPLLGLFGGGLWGCGSFGTLRSLTRLTLLFLWFGLR